MTSLDRCRRAASIVLVVASLILVPASAMAKFAAVQSPAGLSVATATMATLTQVHGSYTCTKAGSTEGINFAISSFTDAGPTGSTYTYTLLRGTTTKATGTSKTHAISLTGTQTDDGASTVWTMTIRAKLSNWNGPLYTTTATCTKASNNSGTF